MGSGCTPLRVLYSAKWLCVMRDWAWWVGVRGSEVEYSESVSTWVHHCDALHWHVYLTYMHRDKFPHATRYCDIHDFTCTLTCRHRDVLPLMQSEIEISYLFLKDFWEKSQFSNLLIFWWFQWKIWVLLLYLKNMHIFRKCERAEYFIFELLLVLL